MRDKALTLARSAVLPNPPATVSTPQCHGEEELRIKPHFRSTTFSPELVALFYPSAGDTQRPQLQQNHLVDHEYRPLQTAAATALQMASQPPSPFPWTFIPKFVGTISLGLLTGQSLTLHQTTLPPLLSLPTPPPALRTFLLLRTLATRSRTLLATISITSFLTAYVLSPRAQRHPYLMYCALGAGIGWGGVDAWFDGFWLDHDRRKEIAAQKAMIEREGIEGGEGGEGVNGEVVRGVMEGWREREGWRGGVWGLVFGAAVLGIWGDGA